MTQQDSASGVWRKRAWYLLLSFLVVMLVLPWLLAKTSLRDRLLTAIVGSDQVSITSRDASFGYVTPLSLTGLHVETADKSSVIEVQRIAAEHSWLTLLFSRPELGTFRFDQPRFDIRVTGESAWEEKVTPAEEPSPSAKNLPQLIVEVRDASVIVRSSETGPPPIDVSGVDVTFRIEREQDTSVLRIDPTTIFDHQPLTPQLCGQGLQLVAPLLADEVAADGEFSMRLNDFYVPLGAESETARRDLRISGELELHRASVTLQNTIAQNLISLIAKLVGESMPDRITVAEGVKVQFKVADGRVEHQGLALVLPHRESSIKIESSGSVGLDETLDLQVSIQLPSGLLAGSRLAGSRLAGSRLATTLSGKPLVVAVGGTFDKPEIGLAGQSSWMQVVGGLLTGDASSGQEENAAGAADPGDTGDTEAVIVDALSEVLGGLLERRSRRATIDPNEPAADAGDFETNQPDASDPDASNPDRTRLRDRLRDRRESRRGL